MYKEHTIGVVISAYQEEDFISSVIADMPAFVDRMYVVDDCSSDGTWEEILEAANHDAKVEDQGSETSEFGRPVAAQSSEATAPDGGAPLGGGVKREVAMGRVVSIRHTENLGPGGAVKTGYLASLADEMDITVTVDGDGQMDLDQMSKLLDPIVEGKADYTKGNRLRYRDYRREMPKFRFIGNSILTFLTKISSGYWKTMDPQNGYTAISQYALKNVGVESMYEYYGYCNDLLVKLNAKGMTVADVALPAKYGEESSSISYPSYIWNVSGMLLGNFLWRLKTKYLMLDFHPLALFYFFGTATVVLGVIGGIWSVYAKLVFGQSFFVRASMSMLLFTMGSMFIMFAMLFDMQVNKEREVQIRE